MIVISRALFLATPSEAITQSCSGEDCTIISLGVVNGCFSFLNHSGRSVKISVLNRRVNLRIVGPNSYLTLPTYEGRCAGKFKGDSASTLIDKIVKNQEAETIVQSDHKTLLTNCWWISDR
jgi:hypothetical protein